MKIVSLRRSLQQAGHCVAEALAAHEHREDPRLVADDLEQAKALIEDVLITYRSMAKGAERGDNVG